jgi:hypothetical protein
MEAGRRVRAYVRLEDYPAMAALTRRRDALPSRRAVRRRLGVDRRLADVVAQAGALLGAGDMDGLKALMAGVLERNLLAPW